MLEAVQAGRSFPGMEHWLPLFHDELVPLTAYLEDGAELAFDHQAQDAIKARAALIGEHYAGPPPAAPGRRVLRRRPLPRRCRPSSSTSTSRISPGWRDARTTWQFSTFGPPPARPAGITAVRDLGGRPARDFAAERADRAHNLFDAIVGHLRELVAAGTGRCSPPTARARPSG